MESPFFTAAALYLGASAFLLGLSLISQQVVNLWKKNGEKFYLFLAFVLTTAGCTGYLAIIFFPAGWLYGLLGDAFVAFLLLYLERRSTFWQKHRRAAFRWTASETALLILIPFLSLGQSAFTYHRHLSAIDSSLLGKQKRIVVEAGRLQGVASQISRDPAVITALQNNTQDSSLPTLLQPLLISQQLSYLAITKPDGTLVSEPAKPNIPTHNLLSNFPWLTGAQAGAVRGVTLSEEGIPMAAAAVPVIVSNQTVGLVIAGTFLDTDYLRKTVDVTLPGLAIANHQGFLASYGSTPGSSALLLANDTETASTTYGTGLEGKFLWYQGQDYLVGSTPLPNLESTQPLYLIAVTAYP